MYSSPYLQHQASIPKSPPFQTRAVWPDSFRATWLFLICGSGLARLSLLPVSYQCGLWTKEYALALLYSLYSESVPYQCQAGECCQWGYHARPREVSLSRNGEPAILVAIPGFEVNLYMTPDNSLHDMFFLPGTPSTPARLPVKKVDSGH